MPDPSPPRLETVRLVLDAHVADDLDDVAAMWADPDVVRHINGKPSSRQESWFRLLRYRGLWPLLGFGYWAIRERETGRFVGDIGLADFRRALDPSIDGFPEAGWVLSRWAHGRGYASEALTAVLEWLDRGEAHRRVVCLVSEGNVASIRVAEKNGFMPACLSDIGSETALMFVRDAPGRSR